MKTLPPSLGAPHSGARAETRTPGPDAAPRRRLRRAGTAVAAFVFVATGYFANSGAYNQNSRLDAIYAFVEPGPDRGTFRIDRFIVDPERDYNTGDWARHGGHYYSNKAPGTTFLGVPVYALLYAIETTAGLSVDDPFVAIANAYLINLVVSALVLALAARAFHELLVARGVPDPRAAWLTLATFLGTALFPYGTQLWGHPSAAAFVVLALRAVERPERAAIAWGGACAGLAVCFDYLAVVAAATLAILALVRHRARAWAFVAGGLAPAVLLLGYHVVCFGDPFTTASELQNPVFLDRSRTLGMVGAPSPRALWALSFGLYRGVFPGMPILLLAALGLGIGLRRDPRCPLLWFGAGTAVLYLVAVASFNGWYGGSTVLPRYLIPALAPLCLGLKELPWRGAWTPLFFAVAAVSILNMLAIAATNPLAPEYHPNPLYGWTYRHFLAGRLAVGFLPTRFQLGSPRWREFAEWTSWNAGELVGLRGLASLIPLAAVGAALLVWVGRGGWGARVGPGPMAPSPARP